MPKNACFSPNMLLHELNKETVTIKCVFCILVQLLPSYVDVPLKTLINRINKLHERCLRVIYNDQKSTFQKLLDKVWELVPEEVKQTGSLNAFQDAIRKWSSTNCPCRLRFFTCCSISAVICLASGPCKLFINRTFSAFLFFDFFFYVIFLKLLQSHIA